MAESPDDISEDEVFEFLASKDFPVATYDIADEFQANNSWVEPVLDRLKAQGKIGSAKEHGRQRTVWGLPAVIRKYRENRLTHGHEPQVALAARERAEQLVELAARLIGSLPPDLPISVDLGREPNRIEVRLRVTTTDVEAAKWIVSRLLGHL